MKRVFRIGTALIVLRIWVFILQIFLMANMIYCTYFQADCNGGFAKVMVSDNPAALILFRKLTQDLKGCDPMNLNYVHFKYIYIRKYFNE